MKHYQVTIVCKVLAEDETTAKALAQDNCGAYLVRTECKELKEDEARKLELKN